MLLSFLITLLILFSNFSSSKIIIFHHLDPYFGNDNIFIIGDSVNFISVDKNLLVYNTLSVDYSINQNVLASIYFPYLYFIGDDKGGFFGDLSFSIKFSIFQSFDLLWRIISEIYFKLPTGVSKEESIRRINNILVSYYPFTSRGSMSSFGVLANLFLAPLSFNLALFYKSENTPNDDLFSFKLSYDRIELQFFIDYLG